MISNIYDSNAFSFGDQHKEFLFEWRPGYRRQKATKSLRTLLWIGGALFLAAIAFVFWVRFSSSTGLLASFKTLGLQDLTQPGIAAISVELPIYLLSFIALFGLFGDLWLQRRLRSSRLQVSHSHVQHISGLPLWLARFLNQNWTLSLHDVRSGQTRLTLLDAAHARGPLARLFITWNADAHKPERLKRGLVPASWFLIDEPAREPIKAPTGLGWRSPNPWTTRAGQALLQKTFDQLPLIAALRTHGVTVPMIGTVR